MFKELFYGTLFITLAVNIMLLFVARDKPPDLSTSTFVSVHDSSMPSMSPTSAYQNNNNNSIKQRRLFLRSNDLNDYSPTSWALKDDQEASAKTSKTHTQDVDTYQEPSKRVIHGVTLKGRLSELTPSPHYSSKAKVSRDIELSVKSDISTSESIQNGNSQTEDQISNYDKVDRVVLVDKVEKFDSSLNSLVDNNRQQQTKASQKVASPQKPTEWLPNFVKLNKDKRAQNDEYQNRRHSKPNFYDKIELNLNGRRGTDKYDVDDGSSADVRAIEGNSDHNNGQVHNPEKLQQLAETKRSPSVPAKLSSVRQSQSSSSSSSPSSSSSWSSSSSSTYTNSNRVKIRVKSSKNHVFVRVNDILIYESKSPNFQQQQQLRHPSSSTDNGNNNDKINYASPNGVDLDEYSDGRGIHVLVLNQYDASVMSRRVFDTYLPGQADELCFYINMIRDGRILIFAIKDEGSFKMAPNSQARALLSKLGSSQIGELRWRDMWAFVTRKTGVSSNAAAQPKRYVNSGKSNYTTVEGLTRSGRFQEWAMPVIVEAEFELASGHKDAELDACYATQAARSADLDEDDTVRRREFCSKLEGYGSVCDCKSPSAISFEPTRIEGSRLDNVPVIVMASNRPYYLHRMLRSLLSSEGIVKSNVVVFVDGFYDEPQMVANLWGVRVIQQRPSGRRSARISHHYKTSLTRTFDLFPMAAFVIIFEEDLDVARDAMIYFNQTLPLLDQDDSLYCVSAWNDQGYEHSARDNRLLYRIETMPGLGWMLKRELYKRELEPNWPSPSQPHDWDMWIRTSLIRKERECIIPDVSRTFHFGSMGTNINSYFQRQYFSKHAFNLVSIGEHDHEHNNNARFNDLHSMTKDSYEMLMNNLVASGTVVGLDWAPTVNATERLCALAQTDYLDLASSMSLRSRRHQAGASRLAPGAIKYQVIYIDMIDKQAFHNWLKLAKCWRIWDLDVRGQHRASWRLFLGGNPVIVVGHPDSPYSRYKPAGLQPFKIS